MSDQLRQASFAEVLLLEEAKRKASKRKGPKNLLWLVFGLFLTFKELIFNRVLNFGIPREQA